MQYTNDKPSYLNVIYLCNLIQISCFDPLPLQKTSNNVPCIVMSDQLFTNRNITQSQFISFLKFYGLIAL